MSKRTGITPTRTRRALSRLRASHGFVFDMDGTLVLGDKSNHGLKPLPGALPLTTLLASRGVPFVLFTNGTARAPKQYAEMLREVGFALPDDGVITPASCASEHFRRCGYRRVLALGGEGLQAPLREAGLEIVPSQGKPEVDAVLVGWFREFTMNDLESACHAAWNGAEVYSCSQSLYFATADGKALGTSRAISAMIRDLTGARIRIIGKPARLALRCAGERLGVRPSNLTVVGDDPSLEVPMAHCGRSLAVGVCTGIGSIESFGGLPKKQRPHLVVRDVSELLKLYEGHK